jgi:hypothetical protein
MSQVYRFLNMKNSSDTDGNLRSSEPSKYPEPISNIRKSVSLPPYFIILNKVFSQGTSLRIIKTHQI